jgi:hypothetical protein
VLVGAAAFDFLRSTFNGCTVVNDYQPRFLMVSLPPETWVWSGYAAFESLGAWNNASLQTMIRISLPVIAPPDMPPPLTDDVATEDQEFMQILSTLFPELTWLFG